jgi:FKBP-type peptidyl-prolyl cis-trans isomerase SlyD
MPLEKGSLVLVDYTARVKDTNEVFETTHEDEAKKTNQYDPTRKYEPRLVSVGESWVLKGLDEALANANIGEKMNVEIQPDKGFGDRDPNKVRMIPQRKLGDKADEVSVGDVIEVDERTGIVRYVGSGRIQVDFNHKFAGRTLLYDVDVIRKLETEVEKISALIKRRMGLEDDKIQINLTAPNLEIDVPEETFLVEGLQVIKRAVANDIFKFVPDVKNIKFVESYKAPAEQIREQQPPPKAEEKPAAAEAKK